ncbi:hypothetical protein [Mycolicibacterium mengxianglii]|uniref:hypothetical protein n=1 Tax=Mycolicibacterium mengxianglii TaxID=2736649 RepID=UPI0018D118E8|nr:hypothetical protein [Mycolicibacterium mengxianglii]
MKPGGRGAFRAVAGVIGTALVVATSAPPAVAEPAVGGLVADAPILSLADLGSDTTIPFYGAQGVTSMTLPVPSGLVPAFLDVVVEVPVNLATGTLTVMQEDRTLARVPLPNADRVPLSIPLTGAVIVDNAVTVTLRSFLVPTGGYCLEPSNPLRLVNAYLRYQGSEIAPQTIAEFLPPVLQQLNMYVPAQPTRAESDAVLRLATAVVARYGQQDTAVTVNALPDGQGVPAGPASPFERRVVIREGPDAALRLTEGPGVPTLLIDGPAADLMNQARLLSSDIGRLALSSKAVVGPLHSSPQLPADVTTLRDLGQPGVNATALSPQVNIALDQTRLGRAAHEVRVHLQGSYTPLPPSVGGQLVASIGGETVDRWQVDNAGVIDRWVTVPDRLLQRYTNLGVALNITGDVGECGQFQPVTLTIDGGSPVESVRADPPVPGGFQSLPQALMPRVNIGISEDFDDTRRAVSILVGLQRLSSSPIDTAVMTVEDAINSSNPAVLIDAADWTYDQLRLPVAGNSDGEISVQDVGGNAGVTTLQLDPGVGFGSLQTIYDGGRTVLVATSNGAAPQLDELLSWLDADPRRWAQLSGDALISAPLRPPVTVVTSAPEHSDAAVAEQKQVIPTVLACSAVAALVVLGGGWMLLRRRRTRDLP